MSGYSIDPDMFPASAEAGYRVNMAGKRPSQTNLALVPGGRYVAAITEIEWSETGEKSKTPGVPMLVATYRIAAGPHEGHELGARYYPSSETAGFFFYGLCEATGNFSDDDWAGDLGAVDIQKKLDGATVVVQVTQKRSDFSDRDDGLRNEVGRAVSLSSPVGRQVAQAAGYDDRMP